MGGTGTGRRNFADRLEEAIDSKKSCLVVGLDPVLERLPSAVLTRVLGCAGDAGWTAQASAAVAVFLTEVIDRVAGDAVAVKPNVAFFERYGPAGWDCLLRVCEKARRAGLLVISDAKRGDIGHTAEAYADALLGDVPDTLGASSDAVTVHPYLGGDGVRPFVERLREGGKGIFVLVRTSNPSAGEIQDLDIGGERLYERVARLVGAWGAGLEGDRGLSPVGAVVAATAPEQARRVREILPKAFFLVPGFGAQGAGAQDLGPFFLHAGRGVVVNASRSILYAAAQSGETWQQSVARAAGEAREALERVRGDSQR